MFHFFYSLPHFFTLLAFIRTPVLLQHHMKWGPLWPCSCLNQHQNIFTNHQFCSRGLKATKLGFDSSFLRGVFLQNSKVPPHFGYYLMSPTQYYFFLALLSSWLGWNFLPIITLMNIEWTNLSESQLCLHWQLDVYLSPRMELPLLILDIPFRRIDSLMAVIRSVVTASGFSVATEIRFVIPWNDRKYLVTSNPYINLVLMIWFWLAIYSLDR